MFDEEAESLAWEFSSNRKREYDSSSPESRLKNIGPWLRITLRPETPFVPLISPPPHHCKDRENWDTSPSLSNLSLADEKVDNCAARYHGCVTPHAICMHDGNPLACKFLCRGRVSQFPSGHLLVSGRKPTMPKRTPILRQFCSSGQNIFTYLLFYPRNPRFLIKTPRPRPRLCFRYTLQFLPVPLHLLPPRVEMPYVQYQLRHPMRPVKPKVKRNDDYISCSISLNLAGR